MSPDPDVLVVGAGLSGLTAAFRLALRGLRVEVYDAGDRPGGVIATRRHPVPEGEVLYELGPNSAMDTSPRVGELLRDLGIAGERIEVAPAAHRRYVVRGGRLVPVPSGPFGLISTPLLSVRARLRLLREPFVPPRADDADESVAAFVRRRLGPEVLDYAVEPLVGGIYAGDPERLSLAATFPMLAALEREYGSLLRGAVLGMRARRRHAAERGEVAKTAAASFSFRAGMQTLTDALARRVGTVTGGAQAKRLWRSGDGFALAFERRDEQFERRAPAVLLALPAYAAAPLLQAVAPPVADALAAVAYPPLATVSSAYRRSEIRHRLDGFGFLAPRVEQAPLLGTLFASSMFAGRAPPGVVLLTSFVGGARDAAAAQAADDHIAADVVRANDRYLGGGAPLFTAVHKWPRAIPQYDRGHLARVAAVAALEQQMPGLGVFGNWRDGVSIADCIVAGHRHADRIGAALAARRG